MSQSELARLSNLDTDLRLAHEYNRKLCTDISDIAIVLARSETLQKANNDLLLESKRVVEAISKKSSDTEYLAKSLVTKTDQQSTDIAGLRGEVDIIKNMPAQEYKNIKRLVWAFIVATILSNALGVFMKIYGI